MFVAGEVHNHLEAWNVILQKLFCGTSLGRLISWSSSAHLREFLRVFIMTVLILMSSCLRFTQYYPPWLASGSAISLALVGTQMPDILSHVGWRSPKRRNTI